MSPVTSTEVQIISPFEKKIQHKAYYAALEIAIQQNLDAKFVRGIVAF
jgi:hypothetical protein